MESVGHAETFHVGSTAPDAIARVSLIRLPSVTLSINQDQQACFPACRTELDRLVVTAPPSPNSCPPGHYMLFLVDGAGVPTVARTVRIGAPPAATRDALAADAPPVVVEAQPSAPAPSSTRVYLRLSTREAAVSAAPGTRVVVGITATCPYGIGACWGGAHEALGLTGVALVHPVPNAADSTAEVRLGDEELPELATCRQEFGRIMNGDVRAPRRRGHAPGEVALREGQLVLARATGPRIRLLPLTQAEKVQWNHTNDLPRHWRTTRPLPSTDSSSRRGTRRRTTR